MSGKITLDQKEFEFLENVFGANEDAEKTEILIPETLIEKNYLSKDENGHLMIRESLLEALQMLEHNRGRFMVSCIDREKKIESMMFSFAGESVLVTEWSRGICEMMIFPELQLAIGKLANYFGNFKNMESCFLKEVPIETGKDVLKDLTGPDEITKVWTVIRVISENKKVKVMQMWETNKEQILGEIEENQIVFSKPDKETLIHTCTKYMLEILE